MSDGFNIFLEALNAGLQGFKSGAKEMRSAMDTQNERDWLENQRQRKLTEQTRADEDYEKGRRLEDLTRQYREKDVEGKLAIQPTAQEAERKRLSLEIGKTEGEQSLLGQNIQNEQVLGKLRGKQYAGQLGMFDAIQQYAKDELALKQSQLEIDKINQSLAKADATLKSDPAFLKTIQDTFKIAAQNNLLSAKASNEVAQKFEGRAYELYQKGESDKARKEAFDFAKTISEKKEKAVDHMNQLLRNTPEGTPGREETVNMINEAVNNYTRSIETMNAIARGENAEAPAIEDGPFEEREKQRRALEAAKNTNTQMPVLNQPAAPKPVVRADTLQSDFDGAKLPVEMDLTPDEKKEYDRLSTKLPARLTYKEQQRLTALQEKLFASIEGGSRNLAPSKK